MNFEDDVDQRFELGDMPEHIKKRHSKDVPSIGSLDDAVLPSVAVHYAEPEILAPDNRLAPVLDSSTKLDTLTQMALKFYEELLEDGPSSDPKMLSSQESAARTILTTQLRVDDSRLKRRETDTLAELLKRMDEEDERLRLTA